MLQYKSMSDEFINSNERLTTEERRKKVATFISNTLKPVQKTLGEFETKERAIQDFESRDYQMEAWNALWQARESGADRGLIHLATGLGKTSIAVFDYAKFRQEPIDAGVNTPRALFVVHQNNILDQANERFSELLPDVDRSFYSNNQKELPKSEITFASFQMLYNSADRLPEDYFDYIIYDEAHHIEADTYKKVVEYFHPKFQLGMTATPERMDEKDITDHFGEALYSKTLPEALAEGYLASVKYTPIYDDAVLELIGSGFSREKLDQLKLLLDIEPRNEEIVKKIIETQQEIRNKEGCETVKTIIFCADIEHANNIAEMMNGESYHSSKNSSEKDDTLDRFRKNGLETITVRDMFNEGVDIPDARLVVFLRTTQSKTIFEQQLGRGLRKTNDKTRVDVLDFVANIERLDMVNGLSDEVETISNRLRSRNGNYAGHNDKDYPIDVDRFEFKFSPQVVGFLKNYRYLIEIRALRVDFNKLTKEELIQLALEKSPGVPLTDSSIRELSKNNEFPGVDKIKRMFGSMLNFQRACGFEVVDRSDLNDLTKEEIIQLAKEISPDEPLVYSSIRELSMNSEFPSPRRIKDMFSSLSNFQRACGFEVVDRSDLNDLTKEEIIQLAKEISPDEPLSLRTITLLSKEGKFITNSKIINMFGSLSNFQRACGFDRV